MINIFGIPKYARTYRGWEYDLWVKVCYDIRHWKEMPIGEAKKLSALAYLCERFSRQFNADPPSELNEVKEYLNSLRVRRDPKPRKPMSAEARQRVSQAQKTRWANRRAAR